MNERIHTINIYLCVYLFSSRILTLFESSTPKRAIKHLRAQQDQMHYGLGGVNSEDMTHIKWSIL